MAFRHHLQATFLALVLPLLGCYPSAAPPGLTDGIWTGASGDRQFVIEFTGSHIAVHALVHTMLEGRRVTERFAFEVSFNPPRMKILIDGDLTYRGKVDLERGHIDGEISGLASAPSEMDLQRVAPRFIEGFLAKPMSGPVAPPYRWSPPAKTGDGWPTANPAEVGLHRSALEKTVAAIIDGEIGLIHSLLVVRHGKLVLEEYFHGYDRDDLHDIGSCTLGVTSLLTGIALDQELNRSLATPVPEFFPQLDAAPAAGWERISLEQLLTMTSAREEEIGFGKQDILAGEAPLAKILSKTPHARPGNEWLYNVHHVNLLAGVLRHSTGLQADRFARTVLFEPLGIERFEWRRVAEGGFPRMHDGLRLRPRDIAKIGALLLGEGQWQDHRVVSSAYVRAATSGQSRSPGPDPEDYGYLWWVMRLPEPASGEPVFMVWGMGSQFLYVAPSLDSVVVLTGGNQFNDKTFLAPRMLAANLLAAYDMD